MEITDANLQQLAGYLDKTLNADPEVRKPVEKLLEQIEVQRNYAQLLLTVIDKEDVPMNVRVAGAIVFKNYIKRNWAVAEDEEGAINNIHPDDRLAIKSLIVTLMLRSPVALQKQLSEAVSMIGKHDFPKKWPQLIDEMVEKFATSDFHIINGVLQTAHSLFKRYRYEFKSQTLWEEIKLVLERMAKPLTDLMLSLSNLANVHAANTEVLKLIYGSLVLVCKVFLSLNSQDLPEFFEDNMSVWMPAFHHLLTVDVPSLHTSDDDEAGVLEHLRSQICAIIGLYAQKYDEEFAKYMEPFVNAVWTLLVKTGMQTKYDALVSNALQFLSVVGERNQYRHIFENPEVLASICEKVVIPNLDFRPSDEELFEESPEEFIRRDIEGSDSETRRRAACDLVKTLSVNFEQKIMAIFGQYLEILLAKYKENPLANWRSKDTAIFLVTSLASRGGTEKHGITQSSELVPLPRFCEEHIITELKRANINELPVLKSAAIKFVMVFRSLLGAPTLFACIPEFIRHLPASSVVVHSYAACAIEKVLVMRDSNQAMLINREALAPLANDLLGSLFNTLALEGSTENEYVMKALMRSFYTLQETTMPYMSIALPRLTAILVLVAKNPSKPHFNHFLFETLSLTIKIVCKNEGSAVSSFEEALFPVFQQILSLDILEFMPYVFQMLSLLLEVREGMGGSIPQPYWMLFPCLLAPALWDRPGNVSPLIRLISAFIRQGSAEISRQAKLGAVLGVFQKMISSKSNDHEGFYLMQNLLTYYNGDELQQHMRDIFSVLFQRLSLSKTTKYVRGMIVFLCYYSVKFGAVALVELIDKIQAHMFGMVINRVLIPDMRRVTTDQDRKIVAIGITKILTECPAMLAPPYIQNWPALLQSLIELFELPPDVTTFAGDHFIEVDDTPGYQAAFSQLNFAKPTTHDFLAEVQNAPLALVQALATLQQTHPTQVPQLISAMGDQHKAALKKYSDQAGLSLF